MLATAATKGAEFGAQYGTAAFFITAGIATMSVGGALYPQMMQDQANAAVLDMVTTTGAARLLQPKSSQPLQCRLVPVQPPHCLRPNQRLEISPLEMQRVLRHAVRCAIAHARTLMREANRPPPDFDYDEYYNDYAYPWL